ncbi:MULTISPECIES: glycosyltransferase family 2 protein [unclassified Natrinema]|uniref:glycosyltransferase family 2 protein n=1 Tax=unclassified Natrinema TaxID=2622230 RepID=UPI00026D529B|nr:MULTISPECIES: glycosyltransferase family 2 protein [unclassified Natrinema]AFO55388.1 glycosyl transferase family 2 [Natrinema sp. J7-2]
MSPLPPAPLDIALLALTAAILYWGFDRYRRRFERRDLAIAIALASGVASLVFVPEAFDLVGTVLEIERRYVVVSLLATLVLLGVVLYALSVARAARDEVAALTRSLSVDRAPRTDGGAETVFVVIPAYNESDTIGTVVSSLPESVRGYDVQPLVVSDGSTDGTAARAASSGAMVVEHPINQGQGGALKTGFEIALEHEAAIVVTADGDGQHPSSELDRLIAPIVEDEADYVMGSRYLGVDRSGNGVVRRTGIRFFTGLINVLMNTDITDCTNGYRAIRGPMLERLTLTEERFNAPELIIEARKNGLRLEEIPVEIADRKDGDSKKPKLGFAIGLTRIIVVAWLR